MGFLSDLGGVFGIGGNGGGASGIGSSQTVSPVTNQSTTLSTDARIVTDQGGLSINAGGGSVSVTDGGAVYAALDTARQAFEKTNVSFAEAIGLASDAQKGGAASLKALTDSAQEVFGELATAQQTAFTSANARAADSLDKLLAFQAGSLKDFTSLAKSISEAGASAASTQAQSLASAFQDASGKSASPLLILSAVVIAGILLWKLSK